MRFCIYAESGAGLELTIKKEFNRTDESRKKMQEMLSEFVSLAVDQVYDYCEARDHITKSFNGKDCITESEDGKIHWQ